MVLARKALLLPASSQSNPASRCASFHSSIANLTDSTVSLLFSTTVLPSYSTSLLPQDQRKGYQKAGGSPQVWPSDCPNGRPFALSFLPAARYSSQVCGNLPSP